MAQTKHCPAGKWTYIIKNFGTGLPRTFRIEITGDPAGVFEERPYFWIFAQRPRTGKLSSVMTFHRKWINGIYRVRVKPTQDVSIRIL